MAKDGILASICCITYNHEKYIRECIEGLLLQKTDFPIEIIIHDDASTDKTAQIVQEYSNQNPELIIPVFQTENQYSKGKKPFINFVFPRARGKYIALCDGDDVWTDPFKLESQVDALESNPEYVVCHHDAVIVDESGNIISSSKLPDDHKRDFTSDELKKAKGMLTLSLCFRNVLQSYPEEYLHASNGDTFLTCLLGAHGKAKYIGEIRPALYRKHPGGIWGPLSELEKGIRLVDTYAWLYRYYCRMNEKGCADYFHYTFTRMLWDWLQRYRLELNSSMLLSPAGFLPGSSKMKNHRFCPDLMHQLQSMLGEPGTGDPAGKNSSDHRSSAKVPPSRLHPLSTQNKQSEGEPAMTAKETETAGVERICRLMLVNHNLAPYELTGTPLTTLSHARGMKAKGLEVCVLIPDPEIGQGFTRSVLDGIPVYRMPKLGQEEAFFSSIPREVLLRHRQIIHDVLQDFRPDIVHINDYVYMPSDIIRCFSRTGIPVVRSICNTEEICYRLEPVLFSGRNVNLCDGPLDMERCAECYCRSRKIDPGNALDSIKKKFIEKFKLVRGLYASEVSAVIFTTPEFKEYFTSFIPTLEEKIRVVPRGFSFPLARPSRPVRVEGNVVKFGFMGTGIPRKGIDVILRALEILIDTGTFELHVFGEIGHETFAAWIGELNKKHPNRIHCRGPFTPEDLPKIVSEIHCAIIPSYFETYNRVVREMLWFGVPVIATDFFGSSIIEDNVNGYRIAGGDSAALADRMSKLIDSPRTIESLSRGALQTPIPLLDDEIEGLLRVYRDLSGIPQARPLADRQHRDDVFGYCIDRLSYLNTIEPIQFATLYIDTGNGFGEEQSLKRLLPARFDEEPVTVEFDLSDFTHIRALRLDPIENVQAGVDVVSAVLSRGEDERAEISISSSNAIYAHDNRFLFATLDPAMYLALPEHTDDIKRIQLVMKYSAGRNYVSLLERTLEALKAPPSSPPLHAKLYIDRGEGFSESSSLTVPLPLESDSGVATLTFPLSGIDPIKALRLDPIENAVAIVEVNKIELHAGNLTKPLRITKSNAEHVKDNRHAFMTDDPSLHLELPTGMECADALVLELKYLVRDAYVKAIGEIVAEDAAANFMKDASGQRYISKLYVDHGSGFIEGDALVLELPCDPKTGRIGLDIDLKPYGKIKALRWDPIEHATPVVELNQLHVYRKGEPIRASVTGTNAKSVCDNILIFASDDPYLEITLPADMPSADRLHVEYRILVRNN